MFLGGGKTCSGGGQNPPKYDGVRRGKKLAVKYIAPAFSFHTIYDGVRREQELAVKYIASSFSFHTTYDGVRWEQVFAVRYIAPFITYNIWRGTLGTGARRQIYCSFHFIQYMTGYAVDRCSPYWFTILSVIIINQCNFWSDYQ